VGRTRDRANTRKPTAPQTKRGEKAKYVVRPAKKVGTLHGTDGKAGKEYSRVVKKKKEKKSHKTNEGQRDRHRQKR